MAGLLGTISGQVRLDIRQAVASYAALRAQNQRTVYALRGTGDVMVRTGQTMAVAGAGFVYAFGQAAQAAAEFERKMDFFGAVTDTNARQMERLREHTLTLARDTIYSADQIAEGFIELGKAGVTAQQIMDGIGEAMANLGAAGDIPLMESGQIITSTIQQFDLAAQDAVRVTDLLAGAANASIADITDIGVSLKYVGGVANAAGLTFEDTATAISLLAKAGIRGSTAGTSLRQMIVSLGGATGPAREALHELGIITEDGNNKFFTAEGRAKSLSQVFQILQSATADLTQKERLMYLRTIFNNRALSAASILTREGAAGFREMNKEMAKTTAADVAAERLDNLSGDIEILRGNIETLMIEAGSPFQEMLRGWVQQLTKLVQAFSELDPETQKFIVGAIGIAGVALILMGAFSIVIGTIARFIINLKRLREAFGFLSKAMGVGSSGAKGAGILGTLTKFGKAAGIIGLLIGAAQAFKKLRDQFGWYERTSNAFFEGFSRHGSVHEGAIVAMAQAWDELNAATGNAPNDAIGWLKALPGQVASFFQRLPGMARAGMASLAASVAIGINNVINWFRRLPSMVLGALASFGSMLARVFTFENVGRLVGAFVTGLVHRFVTLPILIMTHVARLAGMMITGFGNLAGRVAYLVGFMVGRVIGLLARMAIRAGLSAVTLVARFVGFVKSLPGRVMAIIASLVTGVISLVGTLKREGPRIAAEFVAGFISNIRAFPGRVQSVVGRVVSTATSWLMRLPGIAIRAASQLVSGFRSIVSGLPGIVSGVIADMIAAFTGAIGRAYAAAKNVASNLWQGFKDGIGMNSPSYFHHAMWDITGTMDDEMKKLKKQTATILEFGTRLSDFTPGNTSGVAEYARLARTTRMNRDVARDVMNVSASRTANDDRGRRRGDRPSRDRLVEGELDISPRGRAFIRGVAQEAYDDNEYYYDSVGRMG